MCCLASEITWPEARDNILPTPVQISFLVDVFTLFGNTEKAEGKNI